MPVPPRRRRVSRAVRPPAFGVFSRAVRPALRAIDAVHRDGNLPTITVRPVTDRPGADSDGQYWHESIAPPLIEIWRGCAFPSIVCLHEVAHFLDDCGFGLPPGQFASEQSPLLQSWRDAVAGTRAYTRPQALLALPRYGERDANGKERLVCFEEVTLANGNVIDRPVDVELVRYAVTWRELFARSYVQYIVGEGDDKRLWEQFMQTRVGESVILHWDNDFAPVHDALDALMRDVGWR